ncbi:GFA family protein [Alteromonas sp. CYL-A6]|uniref:GFA family protein n=1 Tax=Alteromonas nitratireducens TaxID=3390813 RepID=UPI0034B14B79
MYTQIHAAGSCNCGAISFSVMTPLTTVFICHCSICRKSTGSGGIAVTVVDNEAFKYDSGVELVRTWVKPNHDWLTNFCDICGSPLPGKNDPKRLYIPVSLLDSGYKDLEVKHHIFVDSKASWEQIGDSGKQHKNSFIA